MQQSPTSIAQGHNHKRTQRLQAHNGKRIMQITPPLQHTSCCLSHTLCCRRKTMQSLDSGRSTPRGSAPSNRCHLDPH
eukprot:6160068-Prymnesium_polylepis.2